MQEFPDSDEREQNTKPIFLESGHVEAFLRKLAYITDPDVRLPQFLKNKKQEDLPRANKEYFSWDVITDESGFIKELRVKFEGDQIKKLFSIVDNSALGQVSRNLILQELRNGIKADILPRAQELFRNDDELNSISPALKNQLFVRLREYRDDRSIEELMDHISAILGYLTQDGPLKDELRELYGRVSEQQKKKKDFYSSFGDRVDNFFATQQ